MSFLKRNKGQVPSRQNAPPPSYSSVRGKANKPEPKRSAAENNVSEKPRDVEDNKTTSKRSGAIALWSPGRVRALTEEEFVDTYIELRRSVIAAADWFIKRNESQLQQYQRQVSAASCGKTIGPLLLRCPFIAQLFWSMVKTVEATLSYRLHIPGSRRYDRYAPSSPERKALKSKPEQGDQTIGELADKTIQDFLSRTRRLFMDDLPEAGTEKFWRKEDESRSADFHDMVQTCVELLMIMARGMAEGSPRYAFQRYEDKGEEDDPDPIDDLRKLATRSLRGVRRTRTPLPGLVRYSAGYLARCVTVLPDYRVQSDGEGHVVELYLTKDARALEEVSSHDAETML